MADPSNCSEIRSLSHARSPPGVGGTTRTIEPMIRLPIVRRLWLYDANGPYARDGADGSSGEEGLCRVTPSAVCAGCDDLGPRRHLRHGLGSALSRGSPGPSRDGRRVLDGSDAGHQPAVPRSSSTRPATSPSPRSRRAPRTIPARCRTCSRPARSSSSRRPAPVDLRNWSQWWEFRFGANWRHPYGRGSLDQGPRRSSGRARRLQGCRSLRRSGPARSCRPRPNGSSPRAAASRAPSLPGAMSSRPAASRWPTPGRASSRTRT